MTAGRKATRSVMYDVNRALLEMSAGAAFGLVLALMLVWWLL